MPLSARGFKSVYSRFISLGISFALMTFFTFEKLTFWVDSGSVLVKEQYIVCFQIIGSLALNIAECFPPRAD